MKKWRQAKWIFLVCFLSAIAWGHSRSLHEGKIKKIEKSDFELLRMEYSKTIEPIFRKKCFDCHSQQTVYPWYYKIPLVKQLIDSDIAEGLKHIDMTNGLPFKGHGSLEKDLEAIQKAIKAGTMPPWRYRILHANTSLTAEEKREILEWTSLK